MPLFRSTRAAKSSNVSGASALIVKSDMPANVLRIADVQHPLAHCWAALRSGSLSVTWCRNRGVRTGTLIGNPAGPHAHSDDIAREGLDYYRFHVDGRDVWSTTTAGCPGTAGVINFTVDGLRGPPARP